MKAIRVHAFGAAPQVDEIDPPVASAGRTLVEMHAATVGHIDRTVWGGHFLRHPPLPYVPGVEGAGVVRASSHHPVGARVWLRGSGLGILRDGTWRELIDAPDEAVGALPDAVPMAHGSAFFSPCTSAWVALHEVARLRDGESVLVSGASGAVGSIAVQLALAAGARVHAVVADAVQATRLPAGAQPLHADRLAAGDALGAQVAIDCVGGALLPALLRHVAPGGRAVLVGYAGGHAATLDLPQLLQRDIALLPLNMLRREAAGRAAAADLLGRLGDGRLQLDVTTFPFEQAAAALEWIAQRGHRGRAVLVAAR
jgi:NADPH2:quinone reductase